MGSPNGSSCTGEFSICIRQMDCKVVSIPPPLWSTSLYTREALVIPGKGLYIPVQTHHMQLVLFLSNSIR